MSVIFLIVMLLAIGFASAAGMYVWLWMMRRTGAYLAGRSSEGSGPNDREETCRPGGGAA